MQLDDGQVADQMQKLKMTKSSRTAQERERRLMLNEDASNLTDYDRIVEELAKKLRPAELEELETDDLKEILGAGYEKWEFNDWYVLLTDIKRKSREADHEAMTAERIFNSLPWAAQQAAQEAVRTLLIKASGEHLFNMQVDQAADVAADILWHMFCCMRVNIKNAARNLSSKNKLYSRNDFEENKLLLDFINELRNEQWSRNGEVARLRTRDQDIDKKVIVNKLNELLKLAVPEILEISLSDDSEYVIVNYCNGHKKSICVACDSHTALIRDVMKGIS